jgi:nitrogen regulatory protein PII
MKTIIAMVRRSRVAPSVAALKAIGVACMAVPGVRRYAGRAGEDGTREPGGSRYRWLRRPAAPDTLLPARCHRRRGKRPVRSGLLVLLAGDGAVSAAVDAIIDTSYTGRHGDGEIYVCPMVAALDP